MLYKERGYKKDALLIPGWALDYKILEKLPLRYNLLFPSSYDFEEEILSFLKKKVLIFGHSLGGFLGFSFAIKHPELTEKLILVGIRKGYKKREIEVMRRNLIENKEACLYSFYKNSFNKDEFLKFKKKFLPYYLKMDKEILLEGLEILLKIKIESKLLKKIENCIIVAGGNDKIAPIDSAIFISKKSKKELVLMDELFHIPFLNRDFLEWIKGL
ncbi:MAG: alpha/beta hydrolase [bacterium]